MKKLVTSILVGSLLFGGVAYANEGYEIVNADSEIQETVELTEEAEDVLTEELNEEIPLEEEDVLTEDSDDEDVLTEDSDEEKLEDEIEKILEEIEDALENGTKETTEKLIEDLKKLMSELDKNLEEEMESDVIVLDSPIEDESSKRGENLLRLLEREDLPATAKAGITRALANQERAKERSNSAKAKMQDESVQDSVEDNLKEQDEIIVLDDQEEDELETENTRKQEKQKPGRGKQKNGRSVGVNWKQR